MSETPQDRFLSALLQQDQPLSLPVYKEYRAMLEEKLSKAERKERRARRWTYGMWIAVLTLGLFGAIGHAIVPIEVKPFALTLIMLAYGVFWLALLRLGIYLAVERRALDVARADVRDAAILELSRQVEAIARRLDDLKPAAG
jgi:hypothetical protein